MIKGLIGHVTECKFMYRCTVRPNKPKRQSLEQRKVYCRAMTEGVAHAPQNPEIPEGFQQRIFEGQVKERGHRVCDQLVHSSLMG